MKVRKHTSAYRMIENVISLMQHPSFVVKSDKPLIPEEWLDGLTQEEVETMKTRVDKFVTHLKIIPYKNKNTFSTLKQHLSGVVSKLTSLTKKGKETRDTSTQVVRRKYGEKIVLYREDCYSFWPMKIDTRHNAEWDWECDRWSTIPLTSEEVHKGFKIKKSKTIARMADKVWKVQDGNIIFVRDCDLSYFLKWLATPTQTQLCLYRLAPGCNVKSKVCFAKKWELKKIFWTEPHFWENIKLTSNQKEELQKRLTQEKHMHISKGGIKFYALPGYPRFFVRKADIDWHHFLHTRNGKKVDLTLIPRHDQLILPL